MVMSTMRGSESPAAGPKRYLTRSDVALLLGVSPNTVTRWSREGRLPCQLTLGGHHRFEHSVIEALRESLHREAGAAWSQEYGFTGAGKIGGAK
jgi:excisionase family DNA binding protein